jgi:peptidyl-prolyl cis-trans isomerase SurA
MKSEWRMRIADCGMWNKKLRALISNLKFPIFNFQCSIKCGAWLLAAALFLFAHPCAVRAELVDRVVASVNNDVITLSELEQAVGFNVALGGKQEEKLRAETLEGLINRQLLLQEAYRLKFVEVSGQDITAEIEKLKTRLGSDKAFDDVLARLDMTREQLGRMLGERLLVERFVEKKIGLFVRVSRDEAQDYFNSHPAAFKDKRFQEVQKTITAMLSEQKLEQQVAQYLAELKSKADIRLDP